MSAAEPCPLTLLARTEESPLASTILWKISHKSPSSPKAPFAQLGEGVGIRNKPQHLIGSPHNIKVVDSKVNGPWATKSNNGSQKFRPSGRAPMSSYGGPQIEDPMLVLMERDIMLDGSNLRIPINPMHPK